jgi:hypothetical protein
MHQLIVPDLMIIQMLNGFGEVHKSSDQTNYYWVGRMQEQTI